MLIKLGSRHSLRFPHVHLGKNFTIAREHPAVISEKPVWVFVDLEGYLYTSDSLVRLAKCVAGEWRKDEHLTGWGL